MGMGSYPLPHFAAAIRTQLRKNVSRTMGMLCRPGSYLPDRVSSQYRAMRYWGVGIMGNSKPDRRVGVGNQLFDHVERHVIVPCYGAAHRPVAIGSQY